MVCIGAAPQRWLAKGYFKMAKVTPPTTTTAPATTAPAIPTAVPFSQLVITVPNPQATPPAREGTARYNRWLILRRMAGVTVSTYYAACRKSACGPCTKNNPTLAHNKGFIVLTLPKA